MAARAEELDPADLEVVVTPMRRRHLRGVLRIEHHVYPRPWSLGLFMSELALPVHPGRTWSPGSAPTSSATPG